MDTIFYFLIIIINSVCKSEYKAKLSAKIDIKRWLNLWNIIINMEKRITSYAIIFAFILITTAGKHQSFE